MLTNLPRAPRVRRARTAVVLLALTAALVGRAQDVDSGDTPVTLDDRAVSFRGFWADAFNPGFKSNTDVNTIVTRAVTGRYNAIIPEVLAYQDHGTSGHGSYWNSSILPKATDISGGIDPLATLVTKAHANGLEVHAWIVPYRVCLTWPPSGNTRVQSKWIMVPQANMGGGPAKITDAYYLDAGSPDAQEYIISIVRELVTNYQIDGINYDYIRYVDEDAGYPADPNYAGSSLARFRALTGYVGTPGPSEPSWCDFRRRTISELVRRTRAEIPSIANVRQPLRFTADLIAWGSAPGSFSNSDAYHLFCDWRMWMEKAYLDAGIPMNYKREYDSGEAAMYRSWVSAAIGWRYSRHMFCGQGNYLNRKADSVTQLQYCLSAGANGVVNYSYWDTADENMDGNSENDPNWYGYVAANLFTSTATPPTMPWRDPNTATEGTLWGRVADPGTDTPIDGASVQVGSLAAVQTDGNGYYVVTLIAASAGGTSYTVTASKSGCPTTRLTGVVVRRGIVVRQDINLCDTAVLPGDYDHDGDVDRADLNAFIACMAGDGYQYVNGHMCLTDDLDGDQNVDLADFAVFQQSFTGSL